MAQGVLRSLIRVELENMEECIGKREPSPEEAVWRDFFQQVHELLCEDVNLKCLERLINLFYSMVDNDGKGVFNVGEFADRRSSIDQALDELVTKIDSTNILEFDLRNL